MPRRIDQTIPLNERQILKKTLTVDDTLAVSNVDSDREGYYLFNRTREQTTIDGADVNLDVLTVTEYDDQNHTRLRKTIVVKKRGREVISIDIIPTRSPAETRP